MWDISGVMACCVSLGGPCNMMRHLMICWTCVTIHHVSSFTMFVFHWLLPKVSRQTYKAALPRHFHDSLRYLVKRACYLMVRWRKFQRMKIAITFDLSESVVHIFLSMVFDCPRISSADSNKFPDLFWFLCIYFTLEKYTSPEALSGQNGMNLNASCSIHCFRGVQ